ncbi:MAG: DEAD/DEAH box helicase [Solobacterium sp.]|nr:DEAD/DEAH box helicase [Solobacterium sp.]
MQKQFVRALVGDTSYRSGESIYASGGVGPLNISIDRDAMLIEIEAEVRLQRYPYFARVHVVLDRESNWLIDASCDCSYFRYRHMNCEHIAAVLIKYAEEQDQVSHVRRVRKTDEGLKSLLSSFSSAAALPADQKVFLEAFIEEDFRNTHSLPVRFRIGRSGAHKYMIQNLTGFCLSAQNRESMRFGKALEFVPVKQNIDPSCHALYDFLIDLLSAEDKYAENESYYYSYLSPDLSPRKGLHLKGRYLDRFIEALQDTPFAYHSASLRADIPLHISRETPELVTSMKKEGDGWLFTGSVPRWYLGHDYYYFVDTSQKQVRMMRRDDRQFETVLNYLSEQEEKEHYIAEEDLPAFSRFIYPVVARKTQFVSGSYDPFEYTPMKPEFEIYLDLPQENMITAELYAVYGEKKYNILEGVSSENRRDKDAEQEIDTFLSGWFNSFDNVHHRLALIDDDDKTYAFLKEGIPQLQERAVVFISDALKKIAVRSAPKITAGVSVSHDLLQLDMISDDIDTKQMAEILSRYDRKKKYYRLKSGEFIETGDSFDDLYRLSDELGISKKDLAEGNIRIPQYRAYYLDELADEGFMEIERDIKFRSLVHQIKDTENSAYTLPDGLHAELRPYQKDGFEWLNRLYQNHFGALLADEMGLGKTLQVIAFIGSLKERGRVLIVTPASLVYNWSSEILRFLPSLRSRMIIGSAAARKELIASSDPKDVLITSYDLLKRDLEYYEDMEFTVEIIDEAQYIKNAGTLAAKAVKSVNAAFRIALTGTPIENRLSELWSIFDYMMPGYLFSYRHFRDAYEIPVVRDSDVMAEETVRKMITPFVLRRLKKDVLKDLPEKLEEVYYAPLEDEQKKLYDARVQRLKMILEKETDEEFKENKIAVLAELTRLRQLCCSPSLIYERYDANSAKTDLCMDMIRNAVDAGHKVLLFSQFTSMLDILTERLDAEKIKYHLLTGSTPASFRAAMVSSFAKDSVPVFCISLKAGGTGLNLTAADIVIHYDPWWNTAVENQASDRAHRIGQENIVTVYRLIMKDTIEERILKLQQEKAGLADRILSSEGISSSSLSRRDLLELL